VSGRYLTDLADVLRGAGLRVVEYDGWQTRARGSGGFDGDRPWCVMWHHTASEADVEDDATYCAEGDPDAPVCNLLIGGDGEVWVIAAGASNTNGKGYSLSFSRGRVPDDQMNTHAIGIEICNNGVGETYPQAQIDAAFTASLAICSAYGLDPTDAATHAAWAPDRKIDPATAAAATGFWPSSINSSGTWSLDDLILELLARSGSQPVPPLPGPDPAPPLPPPKDDDMQRITAALDSNGTIWVGDGITRRALSSMETFSNYVILGNAGCFAFVNTSGGQVRELGHVQTVGDATVEALGAV